MITAKVLAKRECSGMRFLRQRVCSESVPGEIGLTKIRIERTLLLIPFATAMFSTNLWCSLRAG